MKQAALPIALFVAACATAETSLPGPDPDGFDAGVEADCPVQCGPGQTCEDDQCVQRTLYVAPAASDTASGTRGSPISLEGALDKVEAGNRIAIATGHYTYFDVIRFPANVLVEGGLDPDTWEATGGETRITIDPPLEMVAVDLGSVGVRRGIALDDVDDFTIRDLEIEVALQGAGAPMLSRGISVYGAHLVGCDGWTLDNVVFRTGTAGDGANGSTGADGATGAEGAIGGTGDDDVQDNCGRGGAGGAGGGNATTPGPSSCARNSSMGRGANGLAAPDPRAGGSGGSGGSGGADSGFDGAQGGPGGVGGAGAPAGTVGSGGGHSGCDGGRDGTPGGPGDPGADGSPVYAPGDRATNFAFDTVFVPGGAGSPGGDGLGGSGGGGGGGGGGESGISCTDGAGSGGGGGGGGGQGGEGGRGGFGGGGAFGIYLHASAGTILGGALEPGAAGNPGVGGEGGGGGGGGPGSGGGPAHAGEIGGGGRGGDGGGGGRGGRGQDGAVGISVGLQCSDGSTSCVTVE